MWSRSPFCWVVFVLFLWMVEHIITSWSRRYGKKLYEDFRPASSGTVGLRDKEKYMSPIWILGWLHWCTVAFLCPLCVSDKCLIPYWKWSRETNCPDLSGTTQISALKFPRLRTLSDKPIIWSLSASELDVSSLHVKDMPQHSHEILNGVPHRYREELTWIG